MTIIFEERLSDSPSIETVTRGYTARDGSCIRPAETNWHMVLRKFEGKVNLLVVGPWRSAGEISYGGGAELLWIRLKLGTFLPTMPPATLLDTETPLPTLSRQSFWLAGSSWQFPDFENADTFVDRMARSGILVGDPVVSATLQDQPEAVPERTVRHHFRCATGLTQKFIQQMQRAQQAQALLRQGTSVLDTVYEAGYFDQAHLTRSLKHFLGYTPAQIARLSKA